jgi:hypothetical protein
MEGFRVKSLGDVISRDSGYDSDNSLTRSHLGKEPHTAATSHKGSEDMIVPNSEDDEEEEVHPLDDGRKGPSLDLESFRLHHNKVRSTNNFGQDMTWIA